MTNSLTPAPIPHPANAPGDFYVELNCCITCGIPMHEAPEIFAWDREDNIAQCVVANQPKTPASIDRTLNAMKFTEVDCIRYRGHDQEISRRIAEMGAAAQCDVPSPTNT